MTNPPAGDNKKPSIATEIFVERGEVIALEHPEIKAEMLACVEEVRGTGQVMGSRPRSSPMIPAAQ